MEADKKQELDYINSILQNKIDFLEKLDIEDSDVNRRIKVKGQINLLRNSMELLRRCYEYDLKPKSVWRKLPNTKNSESEYRIFEDFETENKEVWNELDYFRLDGGEIIIS